MKKKSRVLTFVLSVSIGVAFATGGFAQSITEQVGKAGSDLMTKEKAKAAEEAIKDKATKPKDDKTVPAAKPKPKGSAEKIVVNPFESPDTGTTAASPAQPAKAPPKAAPPKTKTPAKAPSKTEKPDKAGAR